MISSTTLVSNKNSIGESGSIKAEGEHDLVCLGAKRFMAYLFSCTEVLLVPERSCVIIFGKN